MAGASRSNPFRASSPDVEGLLVEIEDFLAEHAAPYEEQYRADTEQEATSFPAKLREIRERAKERGLWNMFLPPDVRATTFARSLSYVDYALMAEVMGRYEFGASIFNCQAPDSGNAEILARFGSDEVRARFLTPLLEGDIHSGFSMTEPAVASSDATNLQLRMTVDGDHVVLDGTKWFTSGATDPSCGLLVVMARSGDGSKYQNHSMVVVPRHTEGVTLGRRPTVFGYDHPSGHPELIYEDVRVPRSFVLGDLGDGFRIAQARLGPGRLHHCMRSIGVAERALQIAIERAVDRQLGDGAVIDKESVQQWVAESRIRIDMARAYTMSVAMQMDAVGPRTARTAISGLKVAVPRMTLDVLDQAIQLHGALGVTQFTPLAHWWALARSLRIGDGPDEVHTAAIARHEVRRSVAAIEETRGGAA
ncbi:MAG: acyl-CoA dehydrogenase family protein [Desertimonas sp.]